MSTKKTILITSLVILGILAALLSLHLMVNGIDLPRFLRSLHGA